MKSSAIKVRLQKGGFSKALLIGQTIIIMCLVFTFIKNDSSLFQEDPSQQSLISADIDTSVRVIKETDGALQNLTTKTQLMWQEDISLTKQKESSSGNTNRSPEFQEKDTIMKERLSLIRQRCSHYMQDEYWQNIRQSGTVLTYEKEDIHYCIVPKVGCTFWKRIFRFLGKDYRTDQNVQKPSDINRNYVHYGPMKNIQQWKVQNPIARMLMTKGKSFMFVRDPFTRLWSAYIDKFLLPDFWRSDALLVVKKLRPNATDYERYCANNVTFQEFLTFIKLTYKNGLNEHWQRLHKVCSPCHVQYDVIGKQESFGLDADYILTKFNLQSLKENTTKLDMVHEEVTTLTKYNFDLENAIRQGCFKKIDVAKRLWLAFQYNGYIDRRTAFPRNDLLKTAFLNSTTEIFTDFVLSTIENQKKLGINIKKQKRTMMLDAYRKIPKDLLNDIISVYEYDFKLFGYNRTLFD
ncbi:carbohydrate sulfotransferase 9-like [Ruditapes philippinarum]|uniref:carbohydrate sulfotransferase 9-like n=1 Tax=Ruditapes philippinarum TaxID=129788 RepID=UPI00295BA081|nr:carbohydrate sulfotransferase 9-like [Ruditapes philippinarum]